MTSDTPQNKEQKQSLDSSGPTLPGDEDEMVQLLWAQHSQLSELMSGVLPPLLDPSKGSRVLDIGWGTGGLVREMASKYPSVHITGIEANASVVEKAQILIRGLSNATILVQDMHHLDDKVFPSASFDLIHMLFLAKDVPIQKFPPLLQSLVRICRPEGLLVWTEAEFPITTSLACQRLCTMVQSGLQASGRAFSPGNSLGVTGRMSHWLGDAVCRITQNRIHAIDMSAGSKGHEAFVRQVEISSGQIRTFLLKMGLTTVAELEDVFLEMQREIREEKFCGMLYLRTLVGVRL